MKKIYFLFAALIISATSFAQAIPGADMETWRSSTSGTTSPVGIQAPYAWYGIDSLIIFDGQFFGSAFGFGPSDFHRQLFEENTTVHGGSHSAKLITVVDSFIGPFPGMLSNSRASIAINPLAGTVSPPTYTGGTPATNRVTSVSAWVQYQPGKVSGVTGIDTGYLLVQALAPIRGYDSVIGTAFLQILPSTSFTQITANLTYIDTVDNIDTIRILFASSGGGVTPNLDSSTLYVDDVTMAGVPFYVNAVPTIATASELVKVYPNPAANTLFFSSNQTGLSCTLFSVNGREVANKTIAGNDALDISLLPAGLYFFAINDEQGNTVQRGKVSVVR